MPVEASQRQNSPQALLTQGLEGERPPADYLGFLRHIWFSSASLLFIFKEMAAGVESLRAGTGRKHLRPHLLPLQRRALSLGEAVTQPRSHGHTVTGLGKAPRGRGCGAGLPGGSFSRFSKWPRGCCQGISTFACVGPDGRAELARPFLTQRKARPSVPEPKTRDRFSCRLRPCTAHARLPSRVQAPCSRGARRNAIHPPASPENKRLFAPLLLEPPCANATRAISWPLTGHTSPGQGLP